MYEPKSDKNKLENLKTLMLSPNNDILVFGEEGLNSTPYIYSYKASYVIDLTNNKITPLITDPQYRDSTPDNFSPDGRYIWFSAPRKSRDDTANWGKYIMDLATIKMIPLITPPIQDEDGIVFLGWIMK